jgi:hypothetical protein
VVAVVRVAVVVMDLPILVAVEQDNTAQVVQV